MNVLDRPDHRLMTAWRLRAHPFAAGDDRFVHQAAALLSAATSGGSWSADWTPEMASVGRALLLALSRNTIALEIKARVLARQSKATIAELIGTDLTTVISYKHLVYDVRNRLDHPTRMAMVLYPSRTGDRLDETFLRGAYRLGSEYLPILFDWRREPFKIVQDELCGWIRASLLMDWALNIDPECSPRVLRILGARTERIRDRDPRNWSTIKDLPPPQTDRTGLPRGEQERFFDDAAVACPEVCLRHLVEAMARAPTELPWVLCG